MSTYSAQDQWEIASVRLDQPLNTTALQSLLAISRTFVNLDGTWHEVKASAETLIQQLGREGWEPVAKNAYTTPYSRLVTEWSFKRRLSLSTLPPESSGVHALILANASLELIVANIVTAFARKAQALGANSPKEAYFRESQALLKSYILPAAKVIHDRRFERELCQFLNKKDLPTRLIVAAIVAHLSELSRYARDDLDKAAKQLHKHRKKLSYIEEVLLLLLAYILVSNGAKSWSRLIEEWQQSTPSELARQAQRLGHAQMQEALMDYLLAALLTSTKDG